MASSRAGHGGKGVRPLRRERVEEAQRRIQLEPPSFPVWPQSYRIVRHVLLRGAAEARKDRQGGRDSVKGIPTRRSCINVLATSLLHGVRVRTARLAGRGRKVVTFPIEANLGAHPPGTLFEAPRREFVDRLQGSKLLPSLKRSSRRSAPPRSQSAPDRSFSGSAVSLP